MVDIHSQENSAEIIRYVQSFDLERNARWVDASLKFLNFDEFFVMTIQGLGKLDSKLVVEDERITKHKQPSNPMGDVGDHLTLSYLWVLGAYEVIRSLCQRSQEDSTFFAKYRKDLLKLKVEFTRIRIPLAKFEPAKKFADTDSHVAYPGFHVVLGTSWQLSENVWINRRTLSDSMLTLFERMK